MTTILIEMIPSSVLTFPAFTIQRRSVCGCSIMCKGPTDHSSIYRSLATDQRRCVAKRYRKLCMEIKQIVPKEKKNLFSSDSCIMRHSSIYAKFGW